MDGSQRCFVFKDTQPGSQWRFAPFCFYVFTPSSSKRKLHCSQTHPCLTWALEERSVHGASPCGCWWGCHLDTCSYLLPFLLPLSWVRGGCLVGVTAKLVSRWRMPHVGPSVYSTEIRWQTWFKMGLNHIRAGGLRGSEKCLISTGRNRERGEDPLSGLSTAQFSRAHARDWGFACLANITQFLTLGD